MEQNNIGTERITNLKQLVGRCFEMRSKKHDENKEYHVLYFKVKRLSVRKNSYIVDAFAYREPIPQLPVRALFRNDIAKPLDFYRVMREIPREQYEDLKERLLSELN